MRFSVVPGIPAAESLTSVLIFMNKRYKFPGAGIKITTGSPLADAAAPEEAA